MTRIEEKLGGLCAAARQNQIQFAVSVEVGEIDSHVGMTKELRLACRLAHIPQAGQVAVPQRTFCCVGIADNPVPRPTGTISVVPGPGEVQRSIAVQVVQAGRKRDRNRRRPRRIVTKQVSQADLGSKRRWPKWWTRGNRSKPNFKFTLTRIHNNEFHATIVAIGEVFAQCVWYELVVV